MFGANKHVIAAPSATKLLMSSTSWRIMDTLEWWPTLKSQRYQTWFPSSISYGAAEGLWSQTEKGQCNKSTPTLVPAPTLGTSGPHLPSPWGSLSHGWITRLGASQGWLSSPRCSLQPDCQIIIRLIVSVLFLWAQNGKAYRWWWWHWTIPNTLVGGKNNIWYH